MKMECSRCHDVIPAPPAGSCTTGYGKDGAGNILCYPCCGEIEKEWIRKKGRTVLYLSEIQAEGLPPNSRKARYTANFRVTDWPGTLNLPITYFKTWYHNIAHTRIDVWFDFEGQEWHGVQYGENTQLLHCKKTKGGNNG